MIQTVSIVGVGLIGGSFALALREAGFSGRLIGVSSPRTLEEALQLGVIDEALPLESAVNQSDLVYLSQPISQILDTLARLDPLVKPGALVTDAGSTKSLIVQRARAQLKRARFLGGHPMAGKESRGVGAAVPDLFRNRTYVLTPLDPSELDAAEVKEFTAWIPRIGARLLVLEPEHHDRVVAFASHLPQLISTALAALLGERSDLSDLEQAAGPGLLDATRLAISPFDIWEDILKTNPGYIQEAVSAYLRKLDEIRVRLAHLPEDLLRQQFEAGSEFATRLRKLRG